ncbi:hypothetical protein DRO97_02245 [Archaeoglobales archaeon]|nr:MAG: hypothetical protein DRO97_02245 [Archaeoglobales archaeon]
MEVRKIQLIGSSSYMVSLPKKWITSLDLKQGDEVIVHVEENRVVVIPKKLDKEKIVRIVMKGIPKLDEDFLRRYVYAIYMLGFDEVVIEDVEIPPSLITKFIEIIHKLVGMEILDVSSTRLVFRILVTPELDIEKVLTRMTQMVNSMFEDAKSLIEGDDKGDKLKNLLMVEENIDRFYWLAVRLENRLTRESASWSEIRFVLGSRMVAKMIEDVADHIVQFVNYINSAKAKDGVVSKIIGEICQMFNLAFNSFINRDVEESDEVVKEVEKMQSKIMNAIKNTDDVGYALSLQTLIEILWEIRSIGEIAINRAVREKAEETKT